MFDALYGVSLQVVDDVLVAHEHQRVRPAEQAHDGARVAAGDETKGGGGVAGVMDSGVTYAGVGQEIFPLPPVCSRPDRLARRIGEHPAGPRLQAVLW